MPTPFRTCVAREAVLIAAFNAGLNAAYTWWLWRPVKPLRLSEPGGVALDLATTPVVIAVLSTLIGTALVRRKIADGRIVVGPATRAHPALHRPPRGVPLRAAVAGALAGVLLALPLLSLLPAAGDGALTLFGAAGTEALITVALPLLIVPAVTWATLADVQRSRGTGRPPDRLPILDSQTR